MLAGFTSRQVCNVTKVPYGTLYEWLSTGLITPSLVKPQGSGKRVLWGFRDIVAIRAIQSLRQHASLSAIRKAVDYIQHHLDVESLSELWLATDGQEIFTLDSLDGGRLLALATRQGQTTLMMCVELKSTTEDLRKKTQASPPAKNPGRPRKSA